MGLWRLVDKSSRYLGLLVCAMGPCERMLLWAESMEGTARAALVLPKHTWRAVCKAGLVECGEWWLVEFHGLRQGPPAAGKWAREIYHF